MDGLDKYPEVVRLGEALRASKKPRDKRLLKELNALLERDFRLESLDK
jgi:hypothetical protein